MFAIRYPFRCSPSVKFWFSKRQPSFYSYNIIRRVEYFFNHAAAFDFFNSIDGVGGGSYQTKYSFYRANIVKQPIFQIDFKCFDNRCWVLNVSTPKTGKRAHSHSCTRREQITCCSRLQRKNSIFRTFPTAAVATLFGKRVHDVRTQVTQVNLYNTSTRTRINQTEIQ